MILKLLLFALLLGEITHADGNKEKKRLLEELFDDYDPLVMPVSGEGQIMNISVGMTLMQLVELDHELHTMEILAWLQLQWKDSYLIWNSSAYGNINSLEVPVDKIWSPDIYIYNHHAESFDATHKTHVVIKPDGSVTFIGPGNFKTICKVNLNMYPLDEQECSLKLGSWVLSGAKIDLNAKHGIVKLYTQDNPIWNIKALPAERNVNYYANLTEPFIDIVFKLNLARKGTSILFYCKLINFFIISLLVISVLLTPSTLLKIIFPLAASGSCLGGVYLASPTNSLVMYDPPATVAFYFRQLTLSFVILIWNVSIHFVYFAPRPMPYWFKSLTVEGKCMLTWLRVIVPKSDVELSAVNQNYQISQRTRLDSSVGEEGSERDSAISRDLARLINKIESGNLITGQKDWITFAVTVDRLICILWILVILTIGFLNGLPSPVD